MRLIIGGVGVGIVLAWLIAWWDQRFVDEYIKREQMTVRPVPRYPKRSH
jgi:hypothetical protein